MLEPFTSLTSKTFTIQEQNVDTDQIIPARFLTTTDRDGLGDFAFRDWRFDRADQPTNHPLNSLDPAATQILIAGDNFGCGSSREHAPWALTAFGFRVVVSTSFGDIFKSNALKNGLLPVVVEAAVLEQLMADDGPVTVDLDAEELRFGNHVISFETEPFARRCLLDGKDQMGALLAALPEIEAFEATKMGTS